MTVLPRDRAMRNGCDSYATGIGFVAVFVLTLFCFLPVLNNTLLHWDDSGYILENSHIRTLSFATMRWAFGEYYLNYWAPLTWLSLALDYAVWGVNPVGYHLTNTILHAFSTGVSFLVGLELVKALRPKFLQNDTVAPAFGIPLPILCSVLAALLFGIHPLRVESVAWATERKDVLGLFFGLPALLCYLRHTQAIDSSQLSSHRIAYRNYMLSLVFFTLSLASKSLMITLPLLLMVLDWYPLKRLKSAGVTAVLIEKAPFLLLSCGAAILTMSAQAKAIEPVDSHTKILNAFKSVVEYMKLTVWPIDLSPFYVHPGSIPGMPVAYLLPVVVVTTITICCALAIRKQPVFMAVWLVYLISLLPFLGFTQVGAQSMAGRFTYLAGLPLAMLLATGVTRLFSKFYGSRGAAVSLGAGVVLMLLFNGYLTVREISFWKDDVTLWTRVIELQPNTGRAYSQRSQVYRAKRNYPKALADISKALAIAESKGYRAMYEIYLERAGILAEMGEFDRAIADYTKALESATAGARAMVHYARGVVYQKSGRNDLASEDFRLSGGSESMR